MSDINVYHKNQYKKIYRSTEKFVVWLEKLGYLKSDVSQHICDMACGGGANILYLSKHFPKASFTGIDFSQELIDYGNERLKEKNNCKLYQGDWFALEPKWKEKFDGIVSFQTLSWLPEYKVPLKQLSNLNPNWIALSSLFYEGDIEYTIKLKNYYRPSNNSEFGEMYYNIYSLIRVRKYFEQLGYNKFEYMPFEIDIDLPQTDNMDIGTYTVKLENKKRIQISAALMMPWYFIVASKD